MFTHGYLVHSLHALLVVGALFAFRPVAETREIRDLPGFSTVQLGTNAKVIVRQGSPQRVVVEGAPADLLKLQTEVVDNQLHIRTKWVNTHLGLFKLGAKRIPLAGSVIVYVTIPTVHGLIVSSSGHLQADTLSAANLNLLVSGSGRLLVGQVQAIRMRAELNSSGQLGITQLRADTLVAGVSSSGNLQAAGNCGYATLDISSSGDLNMAGLVVKDCRAYVSSSGSGQLNVTRTLDARISSSGSVLLSGHPQVTSRISGSGRMRQL